jgi:hypothetical protein
MRRRGDFEVVDERDGAAGVLELAQVEGLEGEGDAGSDSVWSVS